VLLGAMMCLATLALVRGEPGPAILRDTAAALLPVVYLGMPLGSFAAVRLIAGREAILLLMVTIIVSDSAQYYTGRTLGRRPLAPAISPKKTIEGAVGGVVLGAAVMILGGLWVFRGVSPLLLAFASLAVVVAGIVGDLFESLLKRSAGVKDASSLIPGHGGVLDRIDSWLFAGPVYYAFARYLQG
jgi:phosphatidate cytidylyltransferase